MSCAWDLMLRSCGIVAPRMEYNHLGLHACIRVWSDHAGFGGVDSHAHHMTYNGLQILVAYLIFLPHALDSSQTVTSSITSLYRSPNQVHLILCVCVCFSFFFFLILIFKTEGQPSQRQMNKKNQEYVLNLV